MHASIPLLLQVRVRQKCFEIWLNGTQPTQFQRCVSGDVVDEIAPSVPATHSPGLVAEDPADEYMYADGAGGAPRFEHLDA